MKKTFAPIIILAIVALVLVAGGSVWYFVVHKNVASLGAVACTQEAKLCPDGSYVSRTGPNCEFAACPTMASSTIANNTLGWTVFSDEQDGFQVSYPSDFIRNPQLESKSGENIVLFLEQSSTLSDQYWNFQSLDFDVVPLNGLSLQSLLQQEFGITEENILKAGGEYQSFTVAQNRWLFVDQPEAEGGNGYLLFTVSPNAQEVIILDASHFLNAKESPESNNELTSILSTFQFIQLNASSSK
jgi:hypothetical protein